MAKLVVKPKRLDVLDALSNDTKFRINIDVLNECFGANIGMYMRACYPAHDCFKVKNTDQEALIWMPKLFVNSSDWKNRIINNDSLITEVAENGRTEDWMLYSTERFINALRLVFVKESANIPYRFVGVFKQTDKTNCNHKYERVATKVKLIGNPVFEIEIIE